MSAPGPCAATVALRFPEGPLEGCLCFQSSSSPPWQSLLWRLASAWELPFVVSRVSMRRRWRCVAGPARGSSASIPRRPAGLIRCGCRGWREGENRPGDGLARQTCCSGAAGGVGAGVVRCAHGIGHQGGAGHHVGRTRQLRGRQNRCEVSLDGLGERLAINESEPELGHWAIERRVAPAGRRGRGVLAAVLCLVLGWPSFAALAGSK